MFGDFAGSGPPRKRYPKPDLQPGDVIRWSDGVSRTVTSEPFKLIDDNMWLVKIWPMLDYSDEICMLAEEEGDTYTVVRNRSRR